MNDFWVIDGHCDSLGDFLGGKRNLREANQGGHWDIARASEGKVILQFLAAFIESEYKPERATLRGLELIHAAQRFIQENSEAITLIRSKEDVLQLPIKDKIACLLSVEGGEILGDNIFLLDLIYELGVRALGLTWNQRNSIADGAGEQTNSRLTRFGERVIQRMNELGMIIDVSHLNEAGFWHVLELSSQPVIASHSCAHALCSHRRNLTDQQLKSLAQKKGLIGVNFYPEFLTTDGEASLMDVVRHIQHIADVVGVECVGIGSDFDGIDRTPKGLENAGKFGSLADALLDSGFNTREVEQILHKNFITLLTSVIK